MNTKEDQPVYPAAIILGVLIIFACSFSLIGRKTPESSHYAVVSPVVSESSIGLQTIPMLDRQAVSRTDPETIRALGSTLVQQSIYGSLSPEKTSAEVFPSSAEILAMLARDRDVDDYMENASEKGSSGTYYASIASLAPLMKPLREKYEALFTGVYEELKKQGRLLVPAQTSSEAKLYEGGVTLPGLSSPPRERDYDYSHTYALDIFLDDVETLPYSTLEKGPTIFSISDGIVIAANASWKGGEELESYRGGGITPKSGNGVIIYSPSNQKYYLYFHLYDVFVQTGSALRSGQPIGHGGNTGANARKPGHGEHLHIEIYDAVDAKFLRNKQIAALIF
ncbi:MAG: M23 family metallopeptidase [Spirochaetaceae bacterium]|nr:M23 family metallopeptidase [Spirochaetaceae bacterium]